MRPVFLSPYFSSTTAIKGVGSAIAEKLAKLDIENVRDLLWHLPVGVVDRRFEPPLRNAPNNAIISVAVRIEEHRPPRPNQRVPYQVVCQNDSGFVTLTFFNASGDYLEKQLPIGQWRIVSGRAEWFHGVLQMAHPDYIVPLTRREEVMVREPLYPLTAGISNKMLRSFMDRVWEKLDPLPEWQDPHYRQKQGWPEYLTALRALHQPEIAEGQEAARARLAYDEMLAHQLALALFRTQEVAQGVRLPPAGTLTEKLRNHLPFALTAGQEQIVAEMEAELTSGQRMVRLLQGDVGSGKTVLALIAMLRAVEAGMQAVLMAPTEIVSRQHHLWIQKMIAPLGLEIGLLTGSEKGASRTRTLERLASGELPLVVGTHALFQQGVQFKNLGVVVVDEQHRFGVNQRLALSRKATVPPHVLLMSATPIPRTLTMAMFGDMEVSRLTEKPPGRQPIVTKVLPLSRLAEVIAGLKRALETGARAYWVCPLVEASDQLALSAVEERFTELKQHFGERVGIVHGRQKPKERQQTIERFAAGEIQLLLATTVIEVGVNVPEATIMVIEHAEHFGLAQLHQLRGRVGRGSDASHCLLLYGDTTTQNGRARLKILRESEDGFYLAEEDLRLRGGGEILGTKQSGLPDFHFADLYAHHALVLAAKDDAKLLLNRDPTLASERGKAARALLYLFGYDPNLLCGRVV